MQTQKKYLQVASLLEKRVRHGDYVLRDIPAERRLADDMGVSYMTARKAAAHLIEQSLLTRDDNGRLVVPSNRNEFDVLHIALLAPPDRVVGRELMEVIGEANGTLRQIHVHHWDDPVVFDALERFDGMFVVSPPDSLPEEIAQRLLTGRAAVAALGGDLTMWGIPSYFGTPVALVQLVLDHLEALGHRRIDCFNVRPMCQVIEKRIEQWNVWRIAHGMEGKLINEPFNRSGRSDLTAYDAAIKLLDAGELDASAILCVSGSAAVGVIRALYERGIRVGQDISVASCDRFAMAPMMCPSLTSAAAFDPSPSIKVFVDWMARGGKEWIGPLLLQPNPDLFIGESTGKCSC